METILAGVPEIHINMRGRFSRLVAQNHGNALQLALPHGGRYIHHTGVAAGQIGLAGQDLVFFKADGNDPQPGRVEGNSVCIISCARGAAVMLHVLVMRICYGIACFARQNARYGILQALHIRTGLRELFVFRFLQVRPNNTNGNDTYDDEP